MALPMFLWWIALEILSTLAVHFFSPKPDAPQPKGVSDFTLPTIDSTRVVPVVFGSVKLTAPAVIWFGDIGPQGFKIQGVDAGFYYTSGFDLACCHGPVDSFDGLLFDNRSAGWALLGTTADISEYHFDNVMLFGGNRSGGGVQGNAQCYAGVVDPTISTYMQGRTGVGGVMTNYPGLARVAHIVLSGGYDPNFGGVYIGTSEYIKPIAVLATRCPSTLPGLTSGHHRMATGTNATFGFTEYDANPACMLYELLTDSTWGLGLDPSTIDAASFVAVGETLYTEGLGLAMILESASSATDFMREILRHIDGGLSTDPTTGKLHLMLVRADYTIGSLPVYDESVFDELEFTRGSWSETTNVVKVNYTARADDYNPQVLMWQNSSSLQARGETAVAQIDFRGFTNRHTAGIGAARVLKVGSFPLARMSAKANRKAWALRQGDCFVLNWAPLGITGMVCRVTRPAGGELVNGQMTIEFVQDVFAYAATAYGNPDDSQWLNANGAAVACAQQQLVELPHGLIYSERKQVVAYASRANLGLLGVQIWTSKVVRQTAPGGGFHYVTIYVEGVHVRGWCPIGTLSVNYAQNTAYDDVVGFDVGSMVDSDLLSSIPNFDRLGGQNLLMIDNEIMAYSTVIGTGSSITIKDVLRGVYDTVPAAHSAGALVWFISAAPSAVVLESSTAFTPGDTAGAKLLPYNLRNVLPIASATALSLTVAGRADLPMPPGNVKVGAVSWPTSLSKSSTETVSWTERTRDRPFAPSVLAQDAVSAGGTTEGSFEIRIWVGATLKRGPTGSGATNIDTSCSVAAGSAGAGSGSYAYTAAKQTADGVAVSSSVKVRITPVNGSLVGTYQERTWTASA